MAPRTLDRLRPVIRHPDRNITCVSHIDPRLWQWCKEEAKRVSQKIGANGKHPIRAWQILDLALREFRDRIVAEAVPRTCYYLKDGQGPFYGVQAAMDALGVSKKKRPHHNRYDRLSASLKAQIIEKQEVQNGASEGS